MQYDLEMVKHIQFSFDTLSLFNRLLIFLSYLIFTLDTSLNINLIIRFIIDLVVSSIVIYSQSDSWLDTCL